MALSIDEGSEESVATDKIGSIHHPLFKMEYGAAGEATQVSHDNPLPVLIKDFFFEVTEGKVAGYSSQHKFGENLGIPNGSFEDVWSVGGDLTYLTVAQTVHLISSNAGDNQASTTGARSVTITGLDASFNVQTETINLHATVGTTASDSTTNTYIRIFRASVEDAGAYGVTNIGKIDVIEDGGSSIQASIAAGSGQSQGTHYTIPSGKTGYIKRISISVDSGKDVDIEVLRRSGADITVAPTKAWKSLHHWHGIASPVEEIFYHSLAIEEKTDIRIKAQGNGAVAKVEADYDVILVDNV